MPVVGWVISCLDARECNWTKNLRAVGYRGDAAPPACCLPSPERPIQQTADAIERFTQTWIRYRVRNGTGNGGR
jgi:hypothetical protein